MDKNETNKLPEKVVLEETLAKADKLIEATPEKVEKEVINNEVADTQEVSVETVDIEKVSTSAEIDLPDEKVPNESEPISKSHVSKADIVEQLKQLVNGAEDDIKDKIDILKISFYKIHKAETETVRKQDGEESAPEQISDPLEAELKELLNSWREKRAGKVAEQEKERLNNLEKKLKLIEDVKALTESSEDIGRTLPEFRRLQQVWKETGNVPQDQVNEIWKKYQIQVERFYDLLKINNEFREYDFKKNLELKTTLCENAEKLAEESDVVVAFRQLQKLHEDWRETGPVAKEYRDEIWNRFKNASSVINKNHQLFFERLKGTENENLNLKTAICEKLESIDFNLLKSYKDWDAKTLEIIQLQEQWKNIGFAPKKVNNKVFDRFRAACDNFFQKKSEFYKSSKEVLNQNLEKKKALCEKAEALKESTDWKNTSDILIQIQKEWKSIGPVPKKLSDNIWKRFISACDFFFDRKEKEAPSQKNEEIKNLQAKKDLIAKVEGITNEIPEEEALNIHKTLVAEWNEIGHVPFKEKDKVYKAWHEALDKLTERLNISKDNRRLNKFQQNLEDMTHKGQSKVLHERERLLRQFDSITSEIKTAENNIGFFTMSKSSGNSLLNDMQKKIDSLKEERDLIYKKIKMIDDQL